MAAASSLPVALLDQWQLGPTLHLAGVTAGCGALIVLYSKGMCTRDSMAAVLARDTAVLVWR